MEDISESRKHLHLLKYFSARGGGQDQKSLALGWVALQEHKQGLATDFKNKDCFFLFILSLLPAA